MTTTPEVSPLGTVTTAKTASLKSYDKNPRRIPAKAVEQTAKSIREFGWQQPIVVDRDLVIIAGHTRHAAAKSLGLPEVPVIIAEGLTEEQARAFRVADNRTHDYTAWDYTTLVEELNDLGEEFAEVLDVADWSALMQAFETEHGDTAEEAADPKVGSQLLPPEAAGEPIPGAGFVVSVEFATKDDADLAGPALLKLDGVLNVRYPRG